MRAPEPVFDVVERNIIWGRNSIAYFLLLTFTVLRI